MEIIVNGESQMLKEGCYLRELLAQQGWEDHHFAVSINGKIAPRALYDTIELKEGDSIDFILPMQGG
ncbi:sulfur carrier protein ThiS [Pajaroellobacter abortibovis]|uniref:Thiamine biosynthesis protein ThiS n=1 Tax=Pajaroellobacter abortibovis TaxID=1882918 RepID=A0A1L6MW49_9BACT|nr:sulfur carrier protein ThiS [Pajaroellobacter abortibovis]APR99746.1 thiamine biosynthesis protein ThiS [Pajaroellobacter abortibovis]